MPVSPIDVRTAFGQQYGALIEQGLGIGDQGACLVRPDGVIAWRSIEADGAVEALERAIKIAAQPACEPRR